MADTNTEPELIRPRQNLDIKINPAVSPSLHPQNVVALAQLQDGNLDPEMAPYLKPVENLFKGAYDSIGHIYEARAIAKDDTSLTEPAKVLKLAELAEKYQDRLTRNWDSVRKTLVTQIAAIEQQFDSGLKAASDRLPMAAEIRAHFKGLDAGKRMSMLDDAEKKGDMETLRAVLGAPGYLSGLSDDFIKTRARIYHERANAPLAKRLGVLKEAQALLESRGGNLLTEIPKAIGAKWETINKLRATSSATEKVFILRTATE